MKMIEQPKGRLLLVMTRSPKQEYQLLHKNPNVLQTFEKKCVQYNRQTVKLSNKMKEQYLSMCEASGKTPKEVSMVQGKSSKQKIFAFVE